MHKKTNVCLAIIFSIISAFTSAEINTKKLLKTKWSEVKSENFTIVTDAKPKVAKALVQHLESFRAFIPIGLKKQPMTGIRPLKMLALSKNSTFKALDLPEDWAGAFIKDLTASRAIANIQDYNIKLNDPGFANHTLLHEYVHYAMSHLWDTDFYPFWYSEGMAEYLATFRVKGGQIFLGHIDLLQWSIAELRKKTGMGYNEVDVEDLFKTRSLEKSWRGKKKHLKEVRDGKKNFRLFYSRSISVIHYLNSHEKLKASLSKYINYINQGLSVDRSFSKAFETTYKEMDNAIVKYISGKKIVGWSYGNKGSVSFNKVKSEVRDLTTAEFTLELFDVLSRYSVYSRKERRHLYELAEKFNGSSKALITSSNEREFWWISHAQKVDLNTYEQTKKLLRQHPKNSALLTLLGLIKLNEGKILSYTNMKSASKPLTMARNYFRRAINNNMYAGYAYRGLGQIAMLQKNATDKTLKEAQRSLESARLLSNSHTVERIAYDEIHVNLRLHRTREALHLLRRYMTTSESDWSNHYGHFLLEALELKHLDMSQPSVKSDKITYSNESYYQGDIVDGVPHGSGTMYHSSGATLFTHNWKQGLAEGRGILSTSRGFKYEGEFELSGVSGQGVLHYPKHNHTFSYSKGTFKHGYENGLHHFYRNSGAIENGHFLNGSAWGEYTITRKDGSVTTIERAHDYSIVAIDEDNLFSGFLSDDGKPLGKGYCFKKNASTISEISKCTIKEDGSVTDVRSVRYF